MTAVGILLLMVGSGIVWAALRGTTLRDLLGQLLSDATAPPVRQAVRPGEVR